jgi:hypothetical protein
VYSGSPIAGVFNPLSDPLCASVPRLICNAMMSPNLLE